MSTLVEQCLIARIFLVPLLSCQLGGCEQLSAGPSTPLCILGQKIIMMELDDGCVPIDGGLGFLIAGGLGMGVLGVRRRKELELEA